MHMALAPHIDGAYGSPPMTASTAPHASQPAVRLTPLLAISIAFSLLLFYTEIWAVAGIAWWAFTHLFHDWLPVQLLFGALIGLPALWATWKSTGLILSGEYALAAGIV